MLFILVRVSLFFVHLLIFFFFFFWSLPLFFLSLSMLLLPVFSLFFPCSSFVHIPLPLFYRPFLCVCNAVMLLLVWVKLQHTPVIFKSVIYQILHISKLLFPPDRIPSLYHEIFAWYVKAGYIKHSSGIKILFFISNWELNSGIISMSCPWETIFHDWWSLLKIVTALRPLLYWMTKSHPRKRMWYRHMKFKQLL